MNEIRPFAFVLIPFDKEFIDIYRFGIKKLSEDLNVVAERIDEQHFSETILERIYRQIESSDFIIAEMTGKNPNVFYEVGYAHAKGKLCALITQNAADIPFDLKHHMHVVYDGTVADLQEKLRPTLEWLREEHRKRKTETISAETKISSIALEKSKYEHVGSFDLTLDLKNASNRRSPEIEAVYITTSRDWKLYCDGNECPSNPDEEVPNGLRHLIAPPLRRLAPNAFLKIKAEFKRTFWSKFRGDESKETYAAKGNLKIEIVTSEGSFFYSSPLDLEFEEFPF